MRRFRNLPKFSAAELKKMDTLTIGQADDLKIDTGSMRVWLSRVEKNLVSVELLEDGKWILVSEYQSD